MIDIFKNREAIYGFEDLVASYSTSEFDSPRRSTVLLLDYWRSFDSATESFEEMFGVDFSKQGRLHFEYSVPVQAGRGKASLTDLMLIGNAKAFAIEAKFREGAYKLVSKWLSQSNRQNREEVLGGWLNLIQTRTGVSLALDDISFFPYQFIHRTASVCSVPATSRHIVYQLFEPDKEDYYSEHLQALANLLGKGSTLSFVLMICPFVPLEHYQELLDLWDEGARKLSSQVITALKSTRLARFAEPRLVRFA